MKARMRSARCWSCFVTLAAEANRTDVHLSSRAPILGREMPLDPVALRETLLDYGARTFWALIVAAIALLIARAVRGTTMRVLARNRAQANVTILLGNLAQLLVIVVGALGIVAIYTRDTFGWILTSFSVVGLVIGLSLQDILKNFFAGVWVLVERPFRIGDAIEVTGYVGTVDEISFRTTQLRTDDGREVIVPNGTFMVAPVVNLTRFPTRRAAAWLVLPADEKPITAEDVRAALAKARSPARSSSSSRESARISSSRSISSRTSSRGSDSSMISRSCSSASTSSPEAHPPTSSRSISRRSLRTGISCAATSRRRSGSSGTASARSAILWRSSARARAKR